MLILYDESKFPFGIDYFRLSKLVSIADSKMQTKPMAPSHASLSAGSAISPEKSSQTEKAVENPLLTISNFLMG
jgi:hypothetical protein